MGHSASATAAHPGYPSTPVMLSRHLLLWHVLSMIHLHAPKVKIQMQSSLESLGWVEIPLASFLSEQCFLFFCSPKLLHTLILLPTEQQRDRRQAQRALPVFTLKGKCGHGGGRWGEQGPGKVPGGQAEGWSSLKPQSAGGPGNHAVPLRKPKNPERPGRTRKCGQGEKFSHSSKRNCCPGIVHGTVMLISEKQYN